jgi:hypothetical protein
MKTNNVKVLFNAAVVLLIAWAVVACSKKDATPPVVKTDLTASITSANALVLSTHEGVAAGNYLKGSQAPLIAAIAQAQAVADDTNATQVQVTAAIANLAAAVATYGNALVTPIDPDNLIGQWTFDEITSAVADAAVKDYSNGNHNGALKAGDAHWAGTGVPSLAADRYGIAGKALHFDKGQNVEIPYATSLNPQMMSISLWAKQDVETTLYADQYMVAMNRWNGYKFQFQSTPQPFFTARAAITAGDTTIYDHDAGLGSAPLSQGTWYHVVATFGAGHEVFYVNGVQTIDWGTGTNPGTPGTIISLAANPVNLVFGQDLPTSKYSADSNSPYYVNYGGYFHGTLDEIRIYKSVLTQAQVTSIYNLEKP